MKNILKEKYFIKAINEAKKSTCDVAKCGCVIIKSGKVIGKGFNSPSANEKKRCLTSKTSYHSKVTDKTCCVHAEQRAIMDALRRNPGKIKNSSLYFIRLDKNNNPTTASKPYCTICSKMALDVGISEFILWEKEGVCIYNTKEYNQISFNYKGE